MLAYLALCLSEISSSVDQTCQAWEKRDYWVKADRFRLEWAWAGQTYSDLSAQLEAGDLDAGAATAGRLGTHLGAISLPRRTRTDHPWSKAWGSWQESRGLGDDAGKT